MRARTALIPGTKLVIACDGQGPIEPAAALADADKLRPVLNDQHFSPEDIVVANALVQSGALGQLVVEF